MTDIASQPSKSNKRPTTLSVRSDLLVDAKAMRINTSRAAEEGIEAAVKRAKEEAWLAANKSFIQAHNERIDREGTLLTPIWLDR
jgi:antitoxin CcdA